MKTKISLCLLTIVLMISLSYQHDHRHEHSHEDGDNHQHHNHQHQHSHEHNKHDDQHQHQHQHTHNKQHQHNNNNNNKQSQPSTLQPSTSQPQQHQQIYTNKQASTCLTDRATQTCFQILKQCTQNKYCSQQLSQYQSCSFGTVQNNIFNGYCFRKWKQFAKETKQLIQCLDRECNLQYNSVIGYQELMQCVQEMLIQNYQQCPDECLEQLHAVRDSIQKKQIKKLFQELKIENQAARNIITIVKNTCLGGNWKSRQQRRVKTVPTEQVEDTQQNKGDDHEEDDKQNVQHREKQQQVNNKSVEEDLQQL